MRSLLEFKEYLKHFYSKFEAYIKPIGKFILALITLLVINGSMGYQTKLNSLAIVLVVSLMCSFMPMNFIIVCAALFVLLHLYSLSMECAIVVLALFLILFLLYFRFSPKDTIVVILTPLCFMLKIPYAIPLAMGLVGTPASAVSVGCGVTVYYVLHYIVENATVLGALADDMATRFRFIIDGIIDNKSMVVTIVAFAITIILVYMIRRLALDHSWTIAVIAGALMNIMVLLVGELVLDTNVSILGAIIGTIVSVVIVKILEFFVFNVDYSRTENVQFEDDEYYYYVKAVPKITVTTRDKTVKKINSQSKNI